MKLTFILLTTAFLHVSARSTSQEVSFSGKNVSLGQVFNEVKKQTGYVFFYDKAILSSSRPVTIDAYKQPLKIFLDNLFSNQSLVYSIRDKNIIIMTAAARDLRSSLDAVLVPPGDVQGRVTDENGEPLVGANVSIKSTNSEVSTDNSGYFKIKNIEPGVYTVEITYVGYAKKTAEIKVTETGIEGLTFSLARSLVNFDEITVTSTLSKRAIRAYPATIAEIKGKDLQNRNLNNIANVLEAIPGIIITPGSEISNSGSKRDPASILIRGTSAGAQIKYLVDGIEIVSGGLSILEALDPNNIEKIEVLKGPMASTLYGNGAAGGIISITTKRGKQGRVHFNFKTMFTQYANDYADYNGYSQDYSVNVSGGSEQFNYLFDANYNLYPLTKLTDINNGIDDKRWSYMAKIGGKLKNISVDVSIQYGNEKSGVGSTIPSLNKYQLSLGLPPLTIYPLDDNRSSQRSFLSSIHLTHTITKGWSQDLTCGYNMVNYGQASFTPDYAGTYLYFENLSSKMNIRYFTSYDHHWSEAIKSSVTAGFEYNGFESHAISLNSTTPVTNFFAAYSPATASSASFLKTPYSSTGYFAEIVTGVKNNLFLTTGIRYDVNSAYGDNVNVYAQPRVGLSYVIESNKFKIKPRIVWGVSSDPPLPSYKTTFITNTPYYTIISQGNENIKPQRSQGYEFGADFFYGNNYSFNITYYDQKIKDMIQSSSVYDYSTNPLTITTYNYNVAEAINRGLEVSAKALIDPFIIDVSYTETVSKWGDNIGQDPSPIIYPKAPSLNIPKRSIFARVSYKIPSFLSWTKKGGNLSLDWRYNGSSFSFNEISYYLATNAWDNLPDPKPDYPDYNNYYLWQKGYSYFNLRMDYSLANYATLYVDVQNLLDKQGSLNGQTTSQFPGRRINFGFNINF